MKKIILALAALAFSLAAFSEEKSIGVSFGFQPDSYLVDYPSGKQQAVNINGQFEFVGKKQLDKGFTLRTGYAASFGYVKLFGDDIETKTDVDDMIDRNDAQDKFNALAGAIPGVTKASDLFTDYSWKYSNFNGFRANMLGVVGFERTDRVRYGVDFMSGLSLNIASMDTELDSVSYSSYAQQLALAYPALVDGLNQGIASLSNDLGGTIWLLQIGVPFIVKPFIFVTDSIKLFGSFSADVYARNLLFGDQTYTKNLFFKSYELAAGVEVLF